MSRLSSALYTSPQTRMQYMIIFITEQAFNYKEHNNKNSFTIWTKRTPQISQWSTYLYYMGLQTVQKRLVSGDVKF